MAKSKEPFLQFIVKAAGLAAVFGAAAYYLTERYSVGIDAQEHTCLPWRVFVIDKQDKRIARGGIYAFKAQSMAPFFPVGTQIIKVIEGVPGDRVSVTKDDVRINGTKVGEGLALSVKLKKPETRYIREEIIPGEKYWFMGKTADSFDSRYWGYVDQRDILGKAYPIW